uniref:GrBNV_gp61-like protein n=1 Tax=Nilaparvata lugens endogenous nudivirus TaxID=1487700 RepID=X5GY84_9VIRU|nr:GrBNV_gp61-like protein [Nilaparvata lugens endogenous nudivirus]
MSLDVQQSNKCRYVYTLSTQNRTGNYHRVLLANQFYFTKEPKSDEILQYTESDLTSLIRTTLFIHVFRVVPRTKINQVIYTGRLQLTTPDQLLLDDDSDSENRDDDDNGYLKLHMYNSIDSLSCCIEQLDTVFGIGFCSVARRPLQSVYCDYRYMLKWRYYEYRYTIVSLPSADDYIKLYQFMNTVNTELSVPSRFLLNNSRDNRILLQSREKRL